MYELQSLRINHQGAVLSFELENRAYFAATVSDRGDAYFEEFSNHYEALLAEAESRISRFHVLLDSDGAVVGRFNLYDLTIGSATVGYRVAERVSGRGVATSGLRQLCRVCRENYGLELLRALVANDNVASQRVLTKVGFVAVEPEEVGGREGARYELPLSEF